MILNLDVANQRTTFRYKKISIFFLRELFGVHFNIILKHATIWSNERLCNTNELVLSSCQKITWVIYWNQTKACIEKRSPFRAWCCCTICYCQASDRWYQGPAERRWRHRCLRPSAQAMNAAWWESRQDWAAK